MPSTAAGAAPQGASPPPGPAFPPEPGAGRVFEASRSVRATDVTAAGRLRLDAVARYLQEAAEDDVLDSGWDEPHGWLLRMCELALGGYPAHGDRVRLRTFCSGLGPRWAERTTTLAGPRGELISARAIWVAVDPLTGAPAALGPGFHRVYGPSAGGRRASARLDHPEPGPKALPGRPWPLRACDFDTAGHVNNTVHWAAVEEALAGAGWLPSRARIEYHRPALPGCQPFLAAAPSAAGLDVWLMSDAGRLASARLAR